MTTITPDEIARIDKMRRVETRLLNIGKIVAEGNELFESCDCQRCDGRREILRRVETIIEYGREFTPMEMDAMRRGELDPAILKETPDE